MKTILALSVLFLFGCDNPEGVSEIEFKREVFILNEKINTLYSTTQRHENEIEMMKIQNALLPNVKTDFYGIDCDTNQNGCLQIKKEFDSAVKCQNYLNKDFLNALHRQRSGLCMIKD